MKNLKISAVVLVIILAGFQAKAQDTKYYASNMGKKEKRLELRTEHKELRKLNVKNVSNLSLKSFSTDFWENSSNVSWTTTDQFDLATFNKDGQEMTAFYDFGGKLLGSAVNKSFADLPLRGQNSITKMYKKYAVQSVTLYDFNNQNDFQMILSNGQYVDSKNYFVQMSNGKNKIIVQVDLAGQVYYLEKL